MAELLVWKTESLPGGLDGWAMNGVFRTGLKAAIMGELVVGWAGHRLIVVYVDCTAVNASMQIYMLGVSCARMED